MWTFPDAPSTATTAKSIIEGWENDGFRAISEEESKAMPALPAHYVGEFPADATYFLEVQKKSSVVRAFSVFANTLWTSTGVAGVSFGELVHIEVRASPAEARARFETHLETARLFKWRPVTRAEVVALYPGAPSRPSVTS